MSKVKYDYNPRKRGNENKPVSVKMMTIIERGTVEGVLLTP